MAHSCTRICILYSTMTNDKYYLENAINRYAVDAFNKAIENIIIIIKKTLHKIRCKTRRLSRCVLIVLEKTVQV